MPDEPPQADQLCFLCGDPLADGPTSRGHIFPKQFAPQAMRRAEQIALPCADAHRSCDNGFKDDEEYFYAALYPVVAKNNREFANKYRADIQRRAAKPQMRKLVRSILDNASNVTSGGIILPGGMVMWRLDEHRIQRVAIKTARGLLHKAYGRYFAEGECIDIRMCETQAEVPELYDLIASNRPAQIVHPLLFTNWHFYIADERMYLIAMLFWESLLWCATFQAPSEVKPEQLSEAC